MYTTLDIKTNVMTLADICLSILKGQTFKNVLNMSRKINDCLIIWNGEDILVSNNIILSFPLQ